MEQSMGIQMFQWGYNLECDHILVSKRRRGENKRSVVGNTNGTVKIFSDLFLNKSMRIFPDDETNKKFKCSIWKIMNQP